MKTKKISKKKSVEEHLHWIDVNLKELEKIGCTIRIISHSTNLKYHDKTFIEIYYPKGV